MSTVLVMTEIAARAASIRRQQGTDAAKRWARTRGYSIRWDRDGTLYVDDLLARHAPEEK